MVTTFNGKDMVDFAVYCISLIDRGMKKPDEDGIVRFDNSDIENWKVLQDLEKRKDYWFQLKNEKTGAFLEIRGDEGFQACKNLQKQDREGNMFFEHNDLSLNLSTGNWQWRDSNTMSAPGSGDPWFMTGPNVIRRTIG